MGLLSGVMRRFMAAYQEGLQMSCPVHRTTEKVVKRARQRREQIRTAVAQHKEAKGKKRSAS